MLDSQLVASSAPARTGYYAQTRRVGDRRSNHNHDFGFSCKGCWLR